MASRAAVSGATLAGKFFPGTGSTYDQVVRWTTLGLDARWKRWMLDRVPPSRSILDLACGTGILTFDLLRRNPGARVVGVDLTEDYLAVAREKRRLLGGDVTFVHGNAETAPVGGLGPFDAVVSCYIPKYVDADRLLDNVGPSLRPGGAIALHDFAYPRNRVARAVWSAYFALLDPLGARVFPAWAKVFDRSLRDLIVTSPWIEEFRAALVRRGYVDVWVRRLTFGAAAVVMARKPGTPGPPTGPA